MAMWFGDEEPSNDKVEVNTLPADIMKDRFSFSYKNTNNILLNSRM